MTYIDLHIFELVRSDTGHWMIPEHAGSLPLRYLNRSVLGRVVEIGISTPPTSFILEHEGWRLLNSALVRFRIAPLDVHNRFFEIQMDNLCHVYREYNTVADQLAGQAIQASRGMTSPQW